MRTTLYIGLGGFGGKVLAQLKERTAHRSAPGHNSVFLALDRDAEDLRSLEELEIPCARVCKEDYYGALIAEHPQEKKIEAWFPMAAHLVDSNRHNHNNRTCARFDFLSAAESTLSKLLEYALYLHMPTKPEEEPLRVVIITSLAGSTGSGMLIPLALYIRQTAVRLFDAEPQICGFFGGPLMFGAHDETPLRGGEFIRRGIARSYAALRELDYLNQVRTGELIPPEDICLDGLFSCAPGNRPGPIFQHVYLYDTARDPEREELDLVEHMARMGKLAHMRYASPVGENTDRLLLRGCCALGPQTVFFALDEDVDRAVDIFQSPKTAAVELADLPLLENEEFLDIYVRSCRQAERAREQACGPHMDKRFPGWMSHFEHERPVEGLRQTLFIALGGMGGMVLRDLQKRLGSQTDTEQYYYMALDTDDADLEDLAEKTEVEPLSLYMPGPPKEYPRTEAEKAAFGEWFPQTPWLLHSRMGGGRVFGRLAFAWAMRSSVLRRLEQRLLSLYEPADAELLPKVVVITGLGGSTGSGCFIQLALWLKQCFYRRFGKELPVNGFFMGPDMLIRGYELYHDRSACERMRVNTYAALRELDWLTRLRLSEAVPELPVELDGLLSWDSENCRRRIYDYVSFFDADPHLTGNIAAQLERAVRCVAFRHASEEGRAIDQLLHGDLRWLHPGSLTVPVFGETAMAADYRVLGPGVALEECPIAGNEQVLAAYRQACKIAKIEQGAGPHLDRRWLAWIGPME